MMPCITPYDLWGSTCTHAHTYAETTRRAGGDGAKGRGGVSITMILKLSVELRTLVCDMTDSSFQV